MSVEHIKDIEYISETISGHNILRIHLRNLFKPYLLGTSYCDYVTIWWDAQADEYDPALKIYAVTETDDNKNISKVEEWYDLDIAKAIAWVEENLA